MALSAGLLWVLWCGLVAATPHGWPPKPRMQEFDLDDSACSIERRRGPASLDSAGVRMVLNACVSVDIGGASVLQSSRLSTRRQTRR